MIPDSRGVSSVELEVELPSPDSAAGIPARSAQRHSGTGPDLRTTLSALTHAPILPTLMERVADGDRMAPGVGRARRALVTDGASPCMALSSSVSERTQYRK